MTEYVQDMPPPCGYAPLQYERVPLRKGFFNAKWRLAALIFISGLGWVNLHRVKEQRIFERIENRCAKLALIPMLRAETDRMLLKQLRRNREWEEKIMKDVKGWQVGKWRNSPVYLTLGPDDYFPPALEEVFAHAPPDSSLRVAYYLDRN